MNNIHSKDLQSQQSCSTCHRPNNKVIVVPTTETNTFSIIRSPDGNVHYQKVTKISTTEIEYDNNQTSVSKTSINATQYQSGCYNPNSSYSYNSKTYSKSKYMNNSTKTYSYKNQDHNTTSHTKKNSLEKKHNSQVIENPKAEKTVTPCKPESCKSLLSNKSELNHTLIEKDETNANKSPDVEVELESNTIADESISDNTKILEPNIVAIEVGERSPDNLPVEETEPTPNVIVDESVIEKVEVLEPKINIIEVGELSLDKSVDEIVENIPNLIGDENNKVDDFEREVIVTDADEKTEDIASDEKPKDDTKSSSKNQPENKQEKQMSGASCKNGDCEYLTQKIGTQLQELNAQVLKMTEECKNVLDKPESSNVSSQIADKDILSQKPTVTSSDIKERVSCDNKSCQFISEKSIHVAKSPIQLNERVMNVTQGSVYMRQSTPATCLDTKEMVTCNNQSCQFTADKLVSSSDSPAQLDDSFTMTSKDTDPYNIKSTPTEKSALKRTQPRSYADKSINTYYGDELCTKCQVCASGTQQLISHCQLGSRSLTPTAPSSRVLNRSQGYYMTMTPNYSATSSRTLSPTGYQVIARTQSAFPNYQTSCYTKNESSSNPRIIRRTETNTTTTIVTTMPKIGKPR